MLNVLVHLIVMCRTVKAAGPTIKCSCHRVKFDVSDNGRTQHFVGGNVLRPVRMLFCSFFNEADQSWLVHTIAW